MVSNQNPKVLMVSYPRPGNATTPVTPAPVPTPAEPAERTWEARWSETPENDRPYPPPHPTEPGDKKDDEEKEP